MRLVVVTHIIHQLIDGKFSAYAPYVREMDLWLKNFEEIEIIAPVSAMGHSLNHPYTAADLCFVKIPQINFQSPASCLRSLVRMPLIAYRIVKAMIRADHIHLRCPGNVGLMGCVIQVFFPRKQKSVKYAGNWDPRASRPLSYQLQRWILANPFLTRNTKVLIYGQWPRNTMNSWPSITASFSEKERKAVTKKAFQAPFYFLFAGSLVAGKGVAPAIDLVRDLRKRSVDARLSICGEGPERERLKLGEEENRDEGIHFLGCLCLEDLKKVYQQAHFLVLPSKTEGWPKVVAEAMFFGCIPIATPVSCVPWMLGGGKRGLLFRFEADAAKRDHELRILDSLLKDVPRMEHLSKAAREWSQQYTLETLEAGIRKLLEKESGEAETREDLRVLQLIDSLRPGGAERMAVCYANALQGRAATSFLCASRLEGSLKNKIDPSVGYVFLERKHRFSLSAFWKLRKFVLSNLINLIQAHSTSFFLALLIKLSLPRIRLIWQDHGRDLKSRRYRLLTTASYFFDGVISVSEELEGWSQRKLHTKHIIYLRNFVPKAKIGEKELPRQLAANGTLRIVHLAHLRPEKDHRNVLKAFELLLKTNLPVSLHLLGKLEENSYSESLRQQVRELDLENCVYFYGEVEDPQNLLRQADLGVLSSASEGLPLALLEYAQAGLPVVCTAVGQCAALVSGRGLWVPANQPEALARALRFYLSNPENRKKDGEAFQKYVLANYSEDKVLPELLEFFEQVSRESFRKNS